MITRRAPARDEILLGENLELLPRFTTESFQLVYIDPPFNSGKRQTRKTLAAVRAEDGERVGFQGRRYRSRVLAESSYRDCFDDYLAFLEPRLREVRRVLTREGTLYFHIDYREAHHCKLLLDEVFGRECFLNEIVWAYDYGARTRRRWPAKHDTILVYVKDPLRYHFDSEAVDREPYMAPGLVTAEKAESFPRTCGGTRSCPRTGARRPATPRRSPRASFVAWCRPRAARATGVWTASPAAARSEPSPRSSDAATC